MVTGLRVDAAKEAVVLTLLFGAGMRLEFAMPPEQLSRLTEALDQARSFQQSWQNPN